MNQHHQEIIEILHRQQVLESLKSDCQPPTIAADAYYKKIADQCRKKTPPVLRILRILAYLFAILLLVIWLLCNLSLLTAPLLDIPTEELSAVTAAPALYTAETPH